VVNDRVRIAAAFALPILLVMVGAWLSWSETWARAEGELSRTADSAAEYSQRVFGSATLAGRLTNSLLAGATDDEIQADERHYHGLLADIMPELPLANTITVSDGNGDLIVMSTVYPVPEVSVADREWVLALRADPTSAPHVGPLSLGRVAGRPFFSVSVPRDAPDIEEGYEGLINVSLDPFAVARGLAYTTHEAADVLSIIRSDGAILSSTGSNWVDAPRVPDTSPLRPVMIAGEDRGMYEGQSIGLREGLPLGRGLLIAFRRVGDLPVYATVSRPNRAIMAPWFETLARLLVVGVPASLALGLLAMTEARRRSELEGSEAELRAAFENATTGNALVDARSNRILKANTCLGQIAGRPPDVLVGMRLDDLFGEGDTQAPAPFPALTEATLVIRPDGGHRWVELSSAPVTQTGSAESARLIATIHDVTERRQSEERQFVLAREVDHRAKNVLAIVQAIVRLVRDPAARGEGFPMRAAA
jgi:PAS domain S-box-containing protein